MLAFWTSSSSSLPSSSLLFRRRCLQTSPLLSSSRLCVAVPLTLFHRCCRCCRLSSSTSRVDIRVGKLEGSMRSRRIDPRSRLELVGNIEDCTTNISSIRHFLSLLFVVVVVVAVAIADVSDGCTFNAIDDTLMRLSCTRLLPPPHASPL